MEKFKIREVEKDWKYYYYEEYHTRKIKSFPLLPSKEKLSDDYVQWYFNAILDLKENNEI